MPDFKVTAGKITGQFEAAWSAVAAGVSLATPSVRAQMEKNATLAMQDTANALKTDVRANIGSAGFSKRWQNAWRTRVYPAKGYSLDPAAFGYHKIPYAVIFEVGGVINAKAGLLWLPLPSVPKVGRTRATAKRLAQRGVKLFSINRAGRVPLLAAKVKGPAPQKGQVVSASKLAAGTTKVKRGGKTSTVPLFFGVKSVTLRKRFNIAQTTKGVAAKIANFYEQRAGG